MRQYDSMASSMSEEEIKESETETDMDTDIPQVYVFPCFLKPGKQVFMVSDANQDFHLHKFISPQRIDPIPEKAKEIKTITAVRVF
jgi:hypothetical protein